LHRLTRATPATSGRVEGATSTRGSDGVVPGIPSWLKRNLEASLPFLTVGAVLLALAFWLHQAQLHEAGARLPLWALVAAIGVTLAAGGVALTLVDDAVPADQTPESEGFQGEGSTLESWRETEPTAGRTSSQAPGARYGVVAAASDSEEGPFGSREDAFPSDTPEPEPVPAWSEETIPATNPNYVESTEAGPPLNPSGARPATLGAQGTLRRTAGGPVGERTDATAAAQASGPVPGTPSPRAAVPRSNVEEALAGLETALAGLKRGDPSSPPGRGSRRTEPPRLCASCGQANITDTDQLCVSCGRPMCTNCLELSFGTGLPSMCRSCSEGPAAWSEDHVPRRPSPR